MTNLEIVKALSMSAHREYLNISDTITDVAENNGVWTTEVPRQVLQQQANMLEMLKVLANCLRTELEAKEQQ